jgi:large subunit ribosomal protein L15
MLMLGNLKNTTRPYKKMKRVGRGLGSGLGKTCGRGEKGAGSRSGYKRRYTYEGGQFRMFMKMPIRGFSNARFRKRYEVINLAQIDQIYTDGELVNIDTLMEKGYLKGRNVLLKVLGKGDLNKKVTIEADAISQNVQEKLQSANIAFRISKAS